MKRFLKICAVIFGFSLILNTNFLNASCSDRLLNHYEKELNNCAIHWNCTSYEISQLQQNVIQYQNEYNTCINREIDEYNSRVKKYNDASAKKDYVQALNALEQLKKYDQNWAEDINNKILEICEYLWWVYLDKSEYSEAIKYLKKAIEIYENPETLFLLWYAYSSIEDYDNGLLYLRQAKKKSLDSELDTTIDETIEIVELTKEYAIAKKNWETNDPLWYFQYYLPWINIFEAWDKLPENKHKVVVAVIDDGVNINHPDLTENIWVNKKEKDGDWIDNDNNWYIDDYNWWDFTQNEEYKVPSGSHGTMVAGILAASSNNSVGIAWIVPEIEIMPLKVIWDDWNADEENVLNAVNYAINNWANIINLSLTKDQFNFNNNFDPLFEKANKKWIIIVVSAWNGDKLSSEIQWINTTINKVSPVCNENDPKTIIWVWALDNKWFQSKRSNYWDCVDLYIYWENIYSTAINFTEVPYAIGSWTSFSAPIIAWIIWLWFNKYWKISPNVVYDNLKKSLNWNIIDAGKYLDNLSASFWELKNSIRFLTNQWFTKANNPDEFKYNKTIIRDEAAKFFVMYANLFNKNIIINSDDKCRFSDLGEASVNLRSYVINACRYWLLTWENWKFKPWDKLTNAQVINTFMKIYWTNYSAKYFIESNKNTLLDWMIMWKEKNLEKKATRWEIAILLYRWLKILNQK